MFVFQIFLGVIILTFELKRNRAALIDLMSICSIVFFICYVIAPICGYYMYEDFNLYSVMRYTYNGILYGEDVYYISGFLVLLGYLIFVFFYSFSNKISFNSKFHKIFAYKTPYKTIFLFALTILLISLIAFLVESMKVGGPIKWMVSNPRLYHADDAVDIESNSWLMDKLIRFSLISSYLFWGIIKIIKKGVASRDFKKYKTLILFLFFLSLILSTAVVIHAGGRFLLFQYFATFLIAHLIFTNKGLKLIPLMLLVIFGSIILLYGRTFFKMFIYEDALSNINTDDKNLVDYLYSVINNYTFPFYSFVNNVNYSDFSITFFADFLLWPLNFFPNSIRPEFHVDSTAINTYRLMGEYRRFIPTDIFSYGFINFGYFGIFVTLSIFGVLVKKLNWIIYRNPVSIILYVMISFIIGFRIMYFDPYHFFKGSFEVILCLFILSLFENDKKYISYE